MGLRHDRVPPAVGAGDRHERLRIVGRHRRSNRGRGRPALALPARPAARRTLLGRCGRRWGGSRPAPRGRVRHAPAHPGRNGPHVSQRNRGDDDGSRRRARHSRAGDSVAGGASRWSRAARCGSGVGRRPLVPPFRRTGGVGARAGLGDRGLGRRPRNPGWLRPAGRVDHRGPSRPASLAATASRPEEAFAGAAGTGADGPSPAPSGACHPRHDTRAGSGSRSRRRHHARLCGRAVSVGQHAARSDPRPDPWSRLHGRAALRLDERPAGERAVRLWTDVPGVPVLACRRRGGLRRLAQPQSPRGGRARARGRPSSPPALAVRFASAAGIPREARRVCGIHGAAVPPPWRRSPGAPSWSTRRSRPRPCCFFAGCPV